MSRGVVKISTLPIRVNCSSVSFYMPLSPNCQMRMPSASMPIIPLGPRLDRSPSASMVRHPAGSFSGPTEGFYSVHPRILLENVPQVILEYVLYINRYPDIFQYQMPNPQRLHLVGVGLLYSQPDHNTFHGRSFRLLI